MPKEVNRTIKMSTLEKKHLGETVRIGRSEVEGNLIIEGNYFPIMVVEEVYIGGNLHHHAEHHPVRVGSIIYLTVNDSRNNKYANPTANPITWRGYRIVA